MRKLSRLVIAVALLVLSMFASAQAPPAGSTWTGAVVFEIKNHETDFVVGHDITSSPKLFGLKNLTLHVEGLIGYGYRSGNPIAGGAGVLRFAISAADTFELGLAAIYPVDSASPLKGDIRGGFMFGLVHRF